MYIYMLCHVMSDVSSQNIPVVFDCSINRPSGHQTWFAGKPTM